MYVWLDMDPCAVDGLAKFQSFIPVFLVWNLPSEYNDTLGKHEKIRRTFELPNIFRDKFTACKHATWILVQLFQDARRNKMLARLSLRNNRCLRNSAILACGESACFGGFYIALRDFFESSSFNCIVCQILGPLDNLCRRNLKNRFIRPTAIIVQDK